MDDTPSADKDPKDQRGQEDESPAPDPADSSSNVKAPFAPHKDDDSAVGDTDQHSTA
jgi:hypothetical protein